MKAIKCPNCGSEQVKELTEEKYACMACDNVFLIHNHSKEFTQCCVMHLIQPQAQRRVLFRVLTYLH